MSDETHHIEEIQAELAQARRELEIEAALERVRASSMAMHTSDDFHQVAKVLWEQFESLGHEEVDFVGIQVEIPRKNRRSRISREIVRRLQTERWSMARLSTLLRRPGWPKKYLAGFKQMNPQSLLSSKAIISRR